MIGIQQCDWHCGPPLSTFISRAGAITAGNQDKESPMNNVVDDSDVCAAIDNTDAVAGVFIDGA